MAMLAVTLFAWPQLNAQAKGFKDVPKTHSAYESIDFLSTKKIISGYSDGTFKPSANVTNAQAVSMVVKALKLENKSYKDPGFQDVSKANSNYKSIAIATTYGLVEKTTKFNPNQPITREKMARLLAHQVDVNMSHYNKNVSLFSDVAMNNPYRVYINILLNDGVTTGYNDGTFKPKGNVTRANFSQFLARKLGEGSYWKQYYVKNNSDSYTLRNVPKTLTYEYVGETTRTDVYTLNEDPAWIKSKVTDINYTRTYEANDNSGNFIQVQHQYNTSGFYVKALEDYTGYGGASLYAPLKVGDFQPTYLTLPVDRLSETEKKSLDKFGHLPAFSTIESTSTKLVLDGKTFNDVVVVKFATNQNTWSTKMYIAKNDGILKVEGPDFTYTRKFN